MEIKPSAFQIAAVKALLTAQETATQVANTTQDLSTKAIANVKDTTEQVTNFVTETPSTITTVAIQTFQEAGQIAHNLRFENLPTNLQFKFARAGVRQGMRNLTEATQVFETIPAQIRAQGENAIREFCQDKDWSHIQSRANGGGNNASNGIFEHFRINRARGSRNMTPDELAAARSVLHNAAFRATVTQVAHAMTKGALISAAVELVFSILENSLCYVEGKITQDELINNVKDATFQAGIAGGIITALLMAICMIFPPIAVLVGAVAIPLAVTGIGFMTIRAWDIFCHADRLFGITQRAQELLVASENETIQIES